jgi:hypothetical protein
VETSPRLRLRSSAISSHRLRVLGRRAACSYPRSSNRAPQDLSWLPIRAVGGPAGPGGIQRHRVVRRQPATGPLPAGPARLAAARHHLDRGRNRPALRKSRPYQTLSPVSIWPGSGAAISVPPGMASRTCRSPALARPGPTPAVAASCPGCCGCRPRHARPVASSPRRRDAGGESGHCRALIRK